MRAARAPCGTPTQLRTPCVPPLAQMCSMPESRTAAGLLSMRNTKNTKNTGFPSVAYCHFPGAPSGRDGQQRNRLIGFSGEHETNSPRGGRSKSGNGSFLDRPPPSLQKTGKNRVGGLSETARYYAQSEKFSCLYRPYLSWREVGTFGFRYTFRYTPAARAKHKSANTGH